MDQDSILRNLPLSAVVFHVLLALVSGHRHGYVIAKDIEAATNGTVRVGPTTLYRTLKQLVGDGWIAEEESEYHDQRRRVYSLTDRGRDIAAAEAKRLTDAVSIARERQLITATI